MTRRLIQKERLTMNHKQKLGYMALGAGILALGIIIGQFVTPDIEAQADGVFDKIQCRELVVVDKEGTATVRIFSDEDRGFISVYKQSKVGIHMSVDEDGGLIGVRSMKGEGRAGIGINRLGNGAVSTWDKHGRR